MNDLIGYAIRTFLWPIINAGTKLANSMGLYGYDWAILMSGLLVFAAIGVIYLIYRLANALLGRDSYVGYLKYKRKWEADNSGYGADWEIRFEPRPTLAAVIAKWSAPLIVAALVLGILLILARLEIWTTTRTIFHFDVLDQTLQFYLDYAITTTIVCILLLAVTALLAFVLFYVIRIILRRFVTTSIYAELNRFLSRGRIRKGVGNTHGTKNV